MYSGLGNTPSRVLGFPIRTSADQHLVDSSPQLFAVTHVLHRFLAPRHPPLALCSLEEQRCSCLLCSSQRASPASGSCEHAHRARCGSGACARAVREGLTLAGRLPQNGREDKVRRSEREGGRILNFSFVSTEPTNAPTGNWFEPGWTNANQRLNSSSLERR
jgi:hypothetical protein